MDKPLPTPAQEAANAAYLLVREVQADLAKSANRLPGSPAAAEIEWCYSRWKSAMAMMDAAERASKGSVDNG